MVGLDLVQFLDNRRMIHRQSAQLAKRDRRLVVLVRLDEVPGCLGKEYETRVVNKLNSIKHRQPPATYPMTKIKDHKNCIATGMRYEPESLRSLVELLTMAARNRPIVIASWYAPT